MEDLDQHMTVLKEHGYKQEEAIILLMRLQLIKVIQGEIDRRKWSQREAAKILGVAQPRIAEICAMATEKFSVEMLIKFINRLGLRTMVTIKAGKRYVPPRRLRNSVRKGKAKPVRR